MSSSRPYKVKIRESIRETTVKDDSVTSKLDIVPILPNEQQEQVTRNILREHGFQDDDTDSSSSGSSSMSRERNGVTVSINPRTGEIEAKAQEECVVNVSEEDENEEGTGSGGCPCRVRNKEAIVEAMRRRLTKKSSDIQRSVQDLVTGRLQGELADLGCEMEQVANQVTKKSLVQKAREIGNIKSIKHNDSTGEVTIVVEVNS